MRYKFEVPEERWNYVKEKVLPVDGVWCILVCSFRKGDYHYEIGGYNEPENEFYVNFGMGGCVIEAEFVVAWATLFDGDEYLKCIIDQ